MNCGGKGMGALGGGEVGFDGKLMGEGCLQDTGGRAGNEAMLC